MKTSARNCFEGTVTSVRQGAVNDEIEFTIGSAGKTKMTAIITSVSTKNLGLEPGKKVIALIKASWVILLTDTEGVRFSARNQLPGVIASVEKGAVNDEVSVHLNEGDTLTAIITRQSSKNLDLKPGGAVTALIKASHVILGVKE